MNEANMNEPKVVPFQLGAFIPRPDEKFRRWALSFCGRIAQHPAAAGVSEPAALELMAAFQAYNDLYNQARSRATRTMYVTGRKNAAREALESMCRRQAQRIKHDDNVSLKVKEDLFRRRKLRRKHVGPPQSQPVLMLAEMRPGIHKLKWLDSGDGMSMSKSKAADAHALQLFALVANRAMMDHSKLQYIGTYTRQPMRVEWPLDAAGLVVNYVARWINSKGEEGPWSVPLPMQIAFGGVGLQCGSGSGGSRGTAQIEQVRPVRRAA